MTHYNHQKRTVGVDYIWMLSPSVPRAPVPEWTDFVFSEMAQQLARQGFTKPETAWLYFHRLANTTSSAIDAVHDAETSYAGGEEEHALLLDTAAEVAARVPLDAAGFRRALRKLDLERGDALGTLTEAEVQLLITSCDRDGDNCVDGQEWCDRFGAALRRLGQVELAALRRYTRLHSRCAKPLRSPVLPRYRCSHRPYATTNAVTTVRPPSHLHAS